MDLFLGLLELLGVGVFVVLALGLVLGLGVGVAVLGGVETVGTVPGAVLAYQYQIAPPIIRTITIIMVNARPVPIPFFGSSIPGVGVVSSIFLPYPCQIIPPQAGLPMGHLTGLI